MISDAKKNLLKTLAGIDRNISGSVVNLSGFNMEKIEIYVEEHNLKDQFKETTERMIQQNNMEIIPKRLVDNVIENAVEEVKNEKSSKKKLPSLSEAINENDNSSKKIKLLHKKFFLSLSKIRGSERIAKKKIITIIKYGKYENRINRKTTKENLFGKLTKDSNSLFYSVKKINRNLLNKVPKSVYEKDKVFCKLFNKTENQDTIFDEEGEKIPSHTSFIEQKKGIDQSSTLHSIKAPFELFHADIANIKFLSKSAVDPHY